MYPVYSSASLLIMNKAWADDENDNVPLARNNKSNKG
jgi:hypothetical protein